MYSVDGEAWDETLVGFTTPSSFKVTLSTKVRMGIQTFYRYIYKDGRFNMQQIPMLHVGNIRTQTQVSFDKVSSCGENDIFRQEAGCITRKIHGSTWEIFLFFPSSNWK